MTYIHSVSDTNGCRCSSHKIPEFVHSNENISAKLIERIAVAAGSKTSTPSSARWNTLLRNKIQVVCILSMLIEAYLLLAS